MNELINKRVLTNQRHQNMEDFTFFKDKPLYHTAAKRNSQNGEDGILYYIFRCIGVTNRKCIEICAGNGVECNTSNLILNHNFYQFRNPPFELFPYSLHQAIFFGRFP